MGAQHEEAFAREHPEDVQQKDLTEAEWAEAVANGTVATRQGTEESSGESADAILQLTIKLPHPPDSLHITVLSQEQVQDLRQSIIEASGVFQYSCFHLEHQGQPINDFITLSQVAELQADPTLTLLEDPYNEKEARLHFVRIKDMVGATATKADTIYGIDAGASLHDCICGPLSPPEDKRQPSHPLERFSFDKPADLQAFDAPAMPPAPKTIKSLSVSPWNPPPPFLRQQGHLMYIQLTTNEGDQYHITSHVSGFFVNKSSNSKFDPHHKTALKDSSAHSLFTLIGNLSPSFSASFHALADYNNQRDLLVSIPFSSADGSHPWAVQPSTLSLTSHHPDPTRPQEAYLLAGVDGNDTLRDWNEEIQSTKELPRGDVQERVFRERLITKVYVEFTDAAVRGAILVSRGEVTPLNPTEGEEAQIFVYNNIFYSFGADGVGAFAAEGGHEAARIAVKKDVVGVGIVNQLDVAGIHTAGTIVVDYLGKRIVAQSIVPGMFKQREPDEHQVDYGGVDGRDVVASNEVFAKPFAKISEHLKLRQHPVWDKEGKRHDLEASVETKGLLGTDGRKYILDLYRLAPLDVSWLEGGAEFPAYPHKVVVLRTELVEAYYHSKIKEYVQSLTNEAAKSAPDPGKAIENGTNGEHAESEAAETNGDTSAPAEALKPEEIEAKVAKLRILFNPDVFSGQQPPSEAEQAQNIADEQQVRQLCEFLHDDMLPGLVKDICAGEVGFPVDGVALSKMLHNRGISVRYLGRVAELATTEGDARAEALKSLAQEEMVARAFKHEANSYLKALPSVLSAACMSHLLNCLLGTKLNPSPQAQVPEELRSLYPKCHLAFAKATPASLLEGIDEQVRARYRHKLPPDWSNRVKSIPLLRSVAIKLGLQLINRKYSFTADTDTMMINGHAESSVPAGDTAPRSTSSKKKKSKSTNGAPLVNGALAPPPTTFIPDDIANIVPVITDSYPRSSVAEEALEAGKLSIVQGHKDLGQELLLETLTLHEQIYGQMHPQVARIYHHLAMLFYQLDERDAAVELAHKAVIASERTLGLDCSDTILAYMNLSLFEHGNNAYHKKDSTAPTSANPAAAFQCLRHALELYRLVWGSLSHPECTTLLTNGALMLQQAQDFSASRAWFEHALRSSQHINGRDTTPTATLCFQLAQALVLDGQHKPAVQRMREAYSIFLARLGKSDASTRDAERWLETLTSNAVNAAKQAASGVVHSRRGKGALGTGRDFRSLLVHRGQPASTDAKSGGASGAVSGGAGNGGGAGAEGAPGMDSRSIDELIKYIEGGSKGRTSKGSGASGASGPNGASRVSGAGANETTGASGANGGLRGGAGRARGKKKTR